MTLLGELLAYQSGIPNRLSWAVRRWYVSEHLVLITLPPTKLKQGMLFSIVPRFGNTWFLLCLERLDADWLSGCVCLEGLHSDYFCCMWYCYHVFSLDECLFCPVGGRIFCCACILIGWVVCSGLEKKEASMFEMVSNSFVMSEINL